MRYYLTSPIRKESSLIKIFNNSLVDLPAAKNLFVWWNFGSLLGLCLLLQISSGLFLSMHYDSNMNNAFDSVVYLCRDVNYGWFMRALHANGASAFFICLFIHMGRGLYYGSFKNGHTWRLGILLLFLSMATAFMGYVLPWGQMSFWGATVITNLLSVIPYFGDSVVTWLWGGFAVDSPTLSRFFSIHFTLPFVMIGVTVLHLLFLHDTGSNSPLGGASDVEKIPFHIYYTLKDSVGFGVFLLLVLMVTFFLPNLFTDATNFIVADPLTTPVHIQPEWYFLFAYAILRSIPNKLGGVIGLIMSILILGWIPLLHKGKHRPLAFYPISQILFWCLVASFSALSWIGARPVEAPFEVIGQIFTIMYFTTFILFLSSQAAWDKLFLN